MMLKSKMLNSPFQDQATYRPGGKRGQTLTLRTLRRPTVQDKKKIFEHKSVGISKDQIELLQGGGLDGLLHLLSSDHIRVQAILPHIVNHVRYNSETDEVILTDQQSWDYLLELCAVKDLQVRRDAVWAVAIFAAHEECHPYIIKLGWKSILNKLGEDQDPDLNIAVNILIGNLASTKENQMALIEHGGLDTLMKQAQAANDLLESRAAAGAVANAVAEEDNAKFFIDQGGLDILKVLLKKDDNELTEKVVSAIANIAASDNKATQKRIVDDIGLEVIVDGLTNSNPNIRRAAAIAIGHVSATEDLVIRLMDLKVIEKLIALVKAEPVEHESTLGGVAMAFNNLSKHAKAGKQMNDVKLPSFLGILLNSEISEIKTEAEETVANLSARTAYTSDAESSKISSSESESESESLDTASHTSTKKPVADTKSNDQSSSVVSESEEDDSDSSSSSGQSHKSGNSHKSGISNKSVQSHKSTLSHHSNHSQTAKAPVPAANPSNDESSSESESDDDASRHSNHSHKSGQSVRSVNNSKDRASVGSQKANLRVSIGSPVKNPPPVQNNRDDSENSSDSDYDSDRSDQKPAPKPVNRKVVSDSDSSADSISSENDSAEDDSLKLNNGSKQKSYRQSHTILNHNRSSIGKYTGNRGRASYGSSSSRSSASSSSSSSSSSEYTNTDYSSEEEVPPPKSRTQQPSRDRAVPEHHRDKQPRVAPEPRDKAPRDRSPVQSTKAPVRRPQQSAQPSAPYRAPGSPGVRSPHYHPRSPIMGPFSPPLVVNAQQSRLDRALLEKYIAMLCSGEMAQEKAGAAGLVSLATSVEDRIEVVEGMGVQTIIHLHRIFAFAKDQSLCVELCKLLCIVTAVLTNEKMRFADLFAQILNMMSGPYESQLEALVLLPPLVFKHGVNQRMLLGTNIFDILFGLITGGITPEIQGRAGKCLHSLVYQNKQAQDMVGKRNQMSVLVSLLESPELPVQKAGAGVIYAVVDEHPKNQKALVKVGAIPLMTRLLSSPDEPVRQTAAGAFFAMLKDNRKAIEESQAAVQTLIFLLQSRSVGILSNATAVVSEITRVSEKSGDWFCNKEVSANLVYMITVDDFWVVYNSLSIIETLLKKPSPKRREIFLSAGIESAIKPHTSSLASSSNMNAVRKLALKVHDLLRDSKKA